MSILRSGAGPRPRPNYTLEGLDDIIQIVMGRADYHLHHCQFADVMYGVPAPEDRDLLREHSITHPVAHVPLAERGLLTRYCLPAKGYCCALTACGTTPPRRLHSWR